MGGQADLMLLVVIAAVAIFIIESDNSTQMDAITTREPVVPADVGLATAKKSLKSSVQSYCTQYVCPGQPSTSSACAKCIADYCGPTSASLCV